jgi:hypothetical protein
MLTTVNCIEVGYLSVHTHVRYARVILGNVSKFDTF